MKPIRLCRLALTVTAVASFVSILGLAGTDQSTNATASIHWGTLFTSVAILVVSLLGLALVSPKARARRQRRRHPRVTMWSTIQRDSQRALATANKLDRRQARDIRFQRGFERTFGRIPIMK